MRQQKRRQDPSPAHPPYGQTHGENPPDKRNWKRKRKAHGPNTATLPDPVWGRFDCESTAHYLKFVEYRNIPADKRSVAEAARRLSVSEGALAVIARNYRWRERAEAWDVHLALLRDDLSEAATLEMRRGQAKLGRAAQNLALGAIIARDPTKVGPVTALKLAREGADLEREALGLPVGKQAVVVQPSVQSVQIGLALPQGDHAASHPFQPKWLAPAKVVEALPPVPEIESPVPHSTLKEKVEAVQSTP